LVSKKKSCLIIQGLSLHFYHLITHYKDKTNEEEGKNKIIINPPKKDSYLISMFSLPPNFFHFEMVIHQLSKFKTGEFLWFEQQFLGKGRNSHQDLKSHLYHQ